MCVFPKNSISKEILSWLHGPLKWLLNVPFAKLLELSSRMKFFKHVFSCRPSFFPSKNPSMKFHIINQLKENFSSWWWGGAGTNQSLSFHLLRPLSGPVTPRDWGPEVRGVVRSQPANWWESLQSHEANTSVSMPDPQFFSHWSGFFFFLCERKWLL